MGGLSTLVAPQSTPDGEGDRYMTTAEMGAILDAANVRATPEVHERPAAALRPTQYCDRAAPWTARHDYPWDHGRRLRTATTSGVIPIRPGSFRILLADHHWLRMNVAGRRCELLAV